jgi:hypothetical protein
MIYTGLKYQGKLPLDSQYTLLKNEGQEGKIGLSEGGYQSVGGGGHKKRANKGEYNGCVL